MKKIIDKFEEFGVYHSYIKKNARILIGVSGGADSVALTMLFREIQAKYSLFLMVAHVNYHLRGEESNLDERLVKELCYRENIPMYILPAKIEPDESLQQKAREIRFEYFRKLKKNYAMDYIALAHHQQDQAETVLARMLRGAGFGGLSGMTPVKDDIIHPVLCMSKEELIGYLKYKKVEYREDKTNSESKYNRNKIRNELLPHLKAEYNPKFEQKLIDYGSLFYLADNYFAKEVKKYYKKALLYTSDSDLVFELKSIKNLYPILQFYIYKEAWSNLTSSDKDFYAVHYEYIMQIVSSDNGYKEIDLPQNVVVIKDYQNLIFRRKDKYQNEPKENSKELSKERKMFSFNEYRFSMQKLKIYPENGLGNGQDSIVLDYDKVEFPIILRYRMAGDRFIPLGMDKEKKIKDFFIDEKVPLNQRDSVVIFADKNKILWVSGYRIDQRVAVTKETKNFLSIKIDNINDIKNRSLARKVKEKVDNGYNE